MATFLSTVISYLTSAGIRLILALAFVFIAWFLTKKLLEVLNKSKKLQQLDKTVSKFAITCLGFVVKAIILVIGASILGVDMTSVVAIIATLGLTVGLALQGGLSNITGGLIILIFKPFKVDDFIETNGVIGTVSEISIFYTVLKTPDNKTIYLPNASVTNVTVINYSIEEIRRVDFEFAVEYGANTEGVKALLLALADKNELILKNPAPTSRISAFADSSLKVNLRVWCLNENYWDVFFAINEAVKEGFDKFDVKAPLNQVKVHIEK